MWSLIGCASMSGASGPLEVPDLAVVLDPGPAYCDVPIETQGARAEVVNDSDDGRYLTVSDEQAAEADGIRYYVNVDGGIGMWTTYLEPGESVTVVPSASPLCDDWPADGTHDLAVPVVSVPATVDEDGTPDFIGEPEEQTIRLTVTVK